MAARGRPARAASAAARAVATRRALLLVAAVGAAAVLRQWAGALASSSSHGRAPAGGAGRVAAATDDGRRDGLEPLAARWEPRADAAPEDDDARADATAAAAADAREGGAAGAEADVEAATDDVEVSPPPGQRLAAAAGAAAPTPGRKQTSGGAKANRMWYGMYRDGFTGAFVMNAAKYRREKPGAPVRVAKYMSQCVEPNPPRGCDLEVARMDPPRGRGWQRVGRITREWLQQLPATDAVRDASTWKSCAVVGNGGSLLLRESGREIDAHDAVIRFNGGRTKGFERYVGSKTTVRLVNSQHMGFHESEKELLLQHVTIEKNMDVFMKFRAAHPRLKMYAIDGDFHQHVLDTMEDGAASNGFFGMVFAGERCERVTLYGFYKGWRQGDGSLGKGATKYHYYDGVEPNESQQNRDDAETPRVVAFLRKQRRGKFRFAEPQGQALLEDAPGR